jgi:hypothetical protein
MTIEGLNWQECLWMIMVDCEPIELWCCNFDRGCANRFPHGPLSIDQPLVYTSASK